MLLVTMDEFILGAIEETQETEKMSIEFIPYKPQCLFSLKAQKAIKAFTKRINYHNKFHVEKINCFYYAVQVFNE